MTAESRDKELVDRALRSGLISGAQLAEAVKKQGILEQAGVRQSLVEILERDGAVSRDDLEAAAPAPAPAAPGPARGGAGAASTDPIEGLTLGGFLVEKKLGEGGMGAVYRARQVSLGRPVAIKILAPKYAKEKEFVARFEREARAAARLHHPHVVQPLEIGAEKGYHYFAMEFCEGGSVASRIDRDGPFTERDALEVIRAVGQALAYAAELDMVHRDIKPDNILFTRNGQPKLADLGLAKERGDTGLTQTGMILGTPNYMSPEQAVGRRDIDIRSDIYALGIALYEMLTGVVPFKADSALVVLNMHIHEPLPDPRAIRPDLSDPICALVRRMAEKERDDRYPDAKALVSECERLIYRMGEHGGRDAARLAPGTARRKKRPGEGSKDDLPTLADKSPPRGVTTPRPGKAAGERPATPGKGPSEVVWVDEELDPTTIPATVTKRKTRPGSQAGGEAAPAGMGGKAAGKAPTPFDAEAAAIAREEAPRSPRDGTDRRRLVRAETAEVPAPTARDRPVVDGPVGRRASQDDLTAMDPAEAAAILEGRAPRPRTPEPATGETKKRRLSAPRISDHEIEAAPPPQAPPAPREARAPTPRPRPASAAVVPESGAPESDDERRAAPPPPRRRGVGAGTVLLVLLLLGSAGLVYGGKRRPDLKEKYLHEARHLWVTSRYGDLDRRSMARYCARCEAALEAEEAGRPRVTDPDDVLLAGAPGMVQAGAGAGGADAAHADGAPAGLASARVAGRPDLAAAAAAAPVAAGSAPAAPATTGGGDLGATIALAAPQAPPSSEAREEAPSAAPEPAAAAPAAPPPPVASGPRAAWVELLVAGDAASVAGDLPAAMDAYRSAVSKGAPMAEVEPRQAWARAQAALREEPPNHAVAARELANLVARAASVDFARERAATARALAAISRALLALQAGDHEGAARIASQEPLPPSAEATPEAQAAFDRLEAVASDLRGVRDALRLMAQGRAVEGQALLARVKAKPHLDTAAAAGRDLDAIMTFGALLGALEAGDFSSAETQRQRLVGEFGGTSFVSSRRAEVDVLAARIKVEPKLAKLARGASVKALGGGRYRSTWDLAAAGAEKGAVGEAAMHQWTIDRSAWGLDAEGLSCKAQAAMGARSPAALRAPVARIDAVEAVVVPEGFSALTVGGLAQDVTVACYHFDDRGFLAFGPPPGDDEGPRGGKRIREFPKGAHTFTRRFERRVPYTLRIEVGDDAPAAATATAEAGAPAPAAGAEAPEVRAYVDGKGVVRARGPRRTPAADAPVEFRALRGTHLRSVSIEGVPDWPALAKRLGSL